MPLLAVWYVTRDLQEYPVKCLAAADGIVQQSQVVDTWVWHNSTLRLRNFSVFIEFSITAANYIFCTKLEIINVTRYKLNYGYSVNPFITLTCKQLSKGGVVFMRDLSCYEIQQENYWLDSHSSESEVELVHNVR